ncbi:hypothetical protein Ccrd_015135 [Cynara cardunculus var. scolymus]|uniref:Glyoxal oxidase N-terminal domain-containing protein n=1 Tax=Cynara cardunculus var. scolymus TaxID=59895 RepID=A0A103YCE0_CYNCS|nr:hypothetical protein Ccrd_015135 [Cynara cardunculus var. scolymus]
MEKRYIPRLPSTDLQRVNVPPPDSTFLFHIKSLLPNLSTSGFQVEILDTEEPMGIPKELISVDRPDGRLRFQALIHSLVRLSLRHRLEIADKDPELQFKAPPCPVAGGSWSVLLPSIGISAMHMQLLPNNRVVMYDRTDFGISNISFPDGKCRPNSTDCSAHSIKCGYWHPQQKFIFSSPC